MSPSVTDKIDITDGTVVFEILKMYGALVKVGVYSFTARTLMIMSAVTVLVPSVHCTKKL